MKFTIIAVLAGVALADDPVAKAVGTACTKSDDCGDATKMCCGVATMGKMCKAEACTDTTSTVAVPNMMICNNRDTPADFILAQPNFDGSATVYAMYPKASFTCMAGAGKIVATGIALLAAASMM